MPTSNSAPASNSASASNSTSQVTPQSAPQSVPQSPIYNAPQFLMLVRPNSPDVVRLTSALNRHINRPEVQDIASRANNACKLLDRDGRQEFSQGVVNVATGLASVLDTSIAINRNSNTRIQHLETENLELNEANRIFRENERGQNVKPLINELSARFIAISNNQKNTNANQAVWDQIDTFLIKEIINPGLNNKCHYGS